MSVLIDDKFYDSIPEKAKNIVIKKIQKFTVELANNKNLLRKISKGFYCRQVKTVKNRYKFRVNNGDRIVFCYANGRNDIVLLRYCNHDSQILTAKNIAPSFHIEETSYRTDDFDTKIDEQVMDEYKQKLLDDNMIGAYNTLIEKTSAKSNKAKFMRRVLTIKDLNDLYSKSKFSESGLLINPQDSVVVNRDTLYSIFNKIYQEHHLVIAPYFYVMFPESHLLDTIFYAEAANQEKQAHPYIQKLTNELYEKFGTLPKHRSMILQGYFFDIYKYDGKKPEYINLEANLKDNTIVKAKMPVAISTEDHSGRINGYIRALSLAAPKKIERINYQYLFEE